MTTPPAEAPKPFLTGAETGDIKKQKEAVLNDAMAKLNELKQAIETAENPHKREVFNEKLEQFFYSFVDILRQHNGKIPQEIVKTISNGMTKGQVAAIIDGLTKLADDDTDYELAKLKAEVNGAPLPTTPKRNAADLLYNMPDNPVVGMALDPILEQFGIDKKMIKSLWSGFIASILEGVPFAPGIAFAGELRWKAAIDELAPQERLKVLENHTEQKVKAEWLKLYRKWLTDKKSDPMKPAPTPEEAVASLDKPATTSSVTPETLKSLDNNKTSDPITIDGRQYSVEQKDYRLKLRTQAKTYSITIKKSDIDKGWSAVQLETKPGEQKVILTIDGTKVNLDMKKIDEQVKNGDTEKTLAIDGGFTATFKQE